MGSTIIKNNINTIHINYDLLQYKVTVNIGCHSRKLKNCDDV